MEFLQGGCNDKDGESAARRQAAHLDASAHAIAEGYQPKPAPTPIELSSPLSAPPTVNVARGLIARW